MNTTLHAPPPPAVTLQHLTGEMRNSHKACTGDTCEVVRVIEAWQAAQAALDAIAALIGPCPMPDVMNGYDLCGCGLWPCDRTRTHWLASGLDPEEQLAAAIAKAKAAHVPDDATGMLAW